MHVLKTKPRIYSPSNYLKMNRKHFIRTSGLSLASILFSESIFAGKGKKNLIKYPDEVVAILNNKLVPLKSEGKSSWRYNDLIVYLNYGDDKIAIQLQAPQSSVSGVTLRWKKNLKMNSVILNDHWERTYGDISWHQPLGTEILPWYFMEHNHSYTNGFGVKTAASSFCSWQVTGDHVSLHLNTTSGGSGVQLVERKLNAAEIVCVQSKHGESPFETARRFMEIMCSTPCLPKQPVYGINDWYFTYGNNSEKLITEHTELMAPMAEGLENRPFSVIDSGWFIGPPSAPNDCCWGDRMDIPNARFGDMHRMADKIKKIGMRPGIWTRPLCGSYKDSQSVSLPLIKGREDKERRVLDPTIQENLERIKSYFKLYKEWGYDLVKFDYTTYDIMGKWGFEMINDASLTSPGWKMYDNSKTNAEIILNLYKTIREAAGETYIISCNTISHLSAGIFELNRIGDDTSGNEWERTRKMGVNTLAFRGVQNGIFYAADADCVGLTNKIPWAKNKQWMDLVANSGTPLFISAQPDATRSEQKHVIKESFQAASQNLPLAEPLDWMNNKVPEKWKLNGKIISFDWG